VIVRYGIDSPDARLIARDLRSEDGGSSFTAVCDGSEETEIRLRVPGRHNVLNALAALGSGHALGVPLAAMAPGLAAFGGVERRFQRLGEVRGVAIVDDYAHHPTEIRATLAAATDPCRSRGSSSSPPDLSLGSGEPGEGLRGS